MALSQTTEKLDEPKIVQFSIFMDNRVGCLLELIKLLESRSIHAVALSVSDTADAAIARLVFDDPDGARSLLHEHAYAFNECNVIVAQLPESADQLANVLAALLQGETNIHFTYPFLIRPYDKAALALHVDDEEVASVVLRQNGFTLLSQRDISR